MVKYLISFFIIFSSVQSTMSATITYRNLQTMDIRCAEQLKPALIKILKIEEARTLVAKIQEEGVITIELLNNQLSEQFGAFWDEDGRRICLNLNSHRSEGDIIGSIIFELHNAAVNSKLDYFDHLAESGKIDRESYVEAIERLEFENSKMAAAIAEKGIEKGIFPRGARLPTYRNFEEHYHYQKIGGHSAWIGKNFDQLAP